MNSGISVVLTTVSWYLHWSANWYKYHNLRIVPSVASNSTVDKNFHFVVYPCCVFFAAWPDQWKQESSITFIIWIADKWFIFLCLTFLGFEFKRKKEEIWLSPVTKTPTPTEQSKKQRDNIKPPAKTLITQLLRTDLGRSVGVTAVTQLVWLNRFASAQPSH